MSGKTTEKASNVTTLPQFMNENNYTIEDTEEKQSWLSNNLHKLMIGVSLVWFLIVMIYVTQFFGWSNMFLMMPNEFGGFLAGVTLPLAMIWVVMAYIDRGSAFKREAKFLRAYMNQLVYPEDGAPQTAKAMADAIRSQVVELQQASKLAHEQTSQIKDAIKQNVDDFSKLVGKLDTYSTKTIVELNDGVKFLMSNFENILNKTQASTQSLVEINHDFIDGGTGIEQSLNNMFNSFMPRLQELKSTAESLKLITSGSITDIDKANNMVKSFLNETNNSLSNMKNVLTEQMENLKEVADLALDNCNHAKTTVAQEIASMEDMLNRHKENISTTIENASLQTQKQTENLTKLADLSIENINQNIENNLIKVDNLIDQQIKKIDEAIIKHDQEISGFVKTLDAKADEINDKFTAHGEIVSQELDRLMIRSSNLEDSVALQVANLNGISEKAITAIGNLESTLTESVSMLDEKALSANDDITHYIDTLKEKSEELDQTNSNNIDKIVDLTDVLAKRYEELQNKTADGLQQLQEADKQINSSTENLIVQTAQSIENINNVANIMQKHTTSLTDASAVVVTQNQISQASLAQQQKHITDTAAHVEEIKNELKRQIDELSEASTTLEKGAVNIVDVLKSNISKMLENCNETINKSKSINDNLAEQANQFDVAANRTLTKVTQFENILTKQSQNMDTLTQNINDRSEHVAQLLDTQTQKLNDVSTNSESLIDKSVKSFEEKSESIQNISKSAYEYITNVATGLDEKVSVLNVLFRQKEADFYSFSEKVTENTNHMADILKQQLKGIEESADKLFAKLVTLEEDTGRRAESVVDNSQKSVQRLAEIEQLLASEHIKTEQNVDAAIKKLDSINEVVQEHLKIFNSEIVSIKGNVEASLKEITDSSEKLKTLHTSLAENNENIWKKIDEQIVYVENTNIKFNSQSENINAMLEKQKNNITEVVNNLATQARLGEASLAQQYKYLADALVETTQKMQEINNSFKQNSGNIFDTTNKLSYEFDVLGDKLLKSCDMINKASNDSIKNIDKTTLRLNQCSEDLDLSIQNSVKNIGSVFTEYEKYLAGFNTVTAETSSSVMEINDLVSAQSDKMIQISDDTKKLVDLFNNVLSDTSNQLADRANDAYDKVRELGKDLKQLGVEMDEAAKHSITHMEQSGNKLRASVNEIATNVERISNSIVSSGDVFIKQSQALSAIADDTAAKVNSSINSLVEAGKSFNQQGEEIIKGTIRFNDTINTQTKTLADISTKAEETMNNMTSFYKDVKIDTFLKQAEKIINSLESASVDISRIINPKEEEDLWKKFYNGDKQVFVRFISKNINNSQVTTLRKEYENNHEFRNVINKYMSEFESLVEKAKTHEHSGALLALISDADLGRLYYILAKILNKLN